MHVLDLPLAIEEVISNFVNVFLRNTTMSTNKREVPLPNDAENVLDVIDSFIKIVRILRTDCPWDREQTHESISHLLIEEAYETIDAIADNNDKEFAKELGDLLLHVVMHSVLAEERGAFAFIDVIRNVTSKLIHRHPHVFGTDSIDNSGDVLKNWESQKMKEGRTSILEGVPKHIPALLKAQRMQDKASNVGFDWNNKHDVWNKVDEEYKELHAEIEAGNTKKINEEFEDFMFALVNAARFEKIIAEEALTVTNKKFMRRFQFIEQRAKENNTELKDMTLAEMDGYWNEAKYNEVDTKTT